MKFIREDQFRITEKVFSVALIIFAVLGFAGPLLLKQFNLVLLAVYLIVPMVAAAIIWQVIRKKESKLVESDKLLNLIFILLFLICYLCSVIILYCLPVRTIGYYILVAIMGVLILTQILYAAEISEKQSKIILLQISSLFLNIIWGVTLKYYFFVGRTDILFHSWVVQNLAKEGYISKTFDIYGAFPLWHILCTLIYGIIDLPVIPAKVMFIANGLIFGCLVIIIYLTAAKILNRKIALLSSLFLCFNSDAIFYGMYSIPRSVIFFLEALLLFLLVQKKTTLNMTLCILIIIGLIMYHTASMPFILVILVLAFILQMIYHVDSRDRIVNLNFILLLFVTTLTYWMYAGVKVFHSVAGSLLSEAATGTITKSIVQTPLSELFNYLQYSPLLFFVLLGVLWGLRSLTLKSSTKILLITSMLLIPVTYPGPALLLNKLAGNFNLSRFGEYSFLFMCIAGAAGIYVLFRRTKTIYQFSVIILFFFMSFLAVSNDFTASDNPLVKRPFYTYYLSEEECVSIKQSAEISGGYLMSDYITCSFLESSELADKVNVLEVNSNQEFLKASSKDTILIRGTELSGRPLKLYTSPDGKFVLNPSLKVTMDYYDHDSPIWSTLKNYNTVYDSGTVKLYQ